MTKENFETGHLLLIRIDQLDLLKQLLQISFEKKSFVISINMKIYNSNIENNIPITEYNNELRKYGLSLQDEEFILSSIEKRMNELKNEFNNL